MRLIRLLLIISLALTPSLWGATKIAQIDFEDSTEDSIGGASAVWWGGDAPETIQYVAGHTGKALRSSHNSDDGGDDFTIQLSGLPATGEIYIKWWVKYEAEYIGGADGDYPGNWNVKWLWHGPGEAENHTEHIFQSYTPETSTLGFNSYQSAPSLVNFSSTGVPYTRGDWMKVEIYWKQSTGSGTNSDGVFWCRVNDVVRINQTSLVTGRILHYIASPHIKALPGDCQAGEGWWQIDDYEAWDGMPDGAAKWNVSGTVIIH